MSEVLVAAEADTAVPLRLVLAGTFDPAAMLPRRVDHLLAAARAFAEAHTLQQPHRELWDQLLDRIAEAGENRSLVDTVASLRAAAIPMHEVTEAFRSDIAATQGLIRITGLLRDTEDGLTVRSPLLDQAGSLFYSIDRVVHAALLAQYRGERASAHDPLVPRRTLHPYLDSRKDLAQHFHFGSPLFIEASLTSIETPVGLVGLIYAFVKLCGIDLEVRLRRARLRSQLRTEEANARARRLQSVSTSHLPTDPLERELTMSTPEDEDVLIKETVDSWLSATDLFPWKLERGEIADESPDTGDAPGEPGQLT